MHVTPYLDFNGRASDAIDFYKAAVGAQVNQVMRYKDNPDMCVGHPGLEEKVLHCSFKIGSTELMCSDGRCTPDAVPFSGVNLTLTTDTVAEAEKYFNALADGGTILLPLQQTFFSPGFGMTADKFGVNWMIMTKHA